MAQLTQTKIKQLRKALTANEYLQMAFNEHQDTASRLTHWHTYKNFDEYLDTLILQHDGRVFLSNETDIHISINDGIELMVTIVDALNRIGLAYDCFDGGSFVVYEDF